MDRIVPALMMASWRPLIILVGLVGLLLLVSRRPGAQGVFRWLPIPLWCYGLPMVLRTLGWLPATSPAYIWTTTWLLPIALGLLLFGVDLAALWRLSAQALIAMMVGALAIILGGPVMLWALHHHLPSDAWQGIGLLAATWTGGSLNLLAVQAILDTPQAVFAPLVGAVYHPQLAAVGLVLAIGGNAVGTYLGLASATLARWLVQI